MSRPAPIPERLGRVGVWSAGIARIPHLRAFLGASDVVRRPHGWVRAIDHVVGWGRKANTRAARAAARRAGVPFLALEDGFLRSVGLGVEGEPPLSIVLDDLGIYYDATRPSRLETWLAEGEFGAEEQARARRVMAQLEAAGLSKYNHQPELDLGPRAGKRVLVVDQTAGDLSVRLGLCVGGFEEMLAAALHEHPDAEILVKTHPDVLAGAKAGHLGGALPERVRLLTTPAHPPSLLDQVDHVYVMTSLMGFEALLRGVSVTCFGVPFYAGWGLTDDRADVPARRRVARTLEELFAAAYLRYARYVDPETGNRCELERVIEHLALQRRWGELNRGTWVAVGFSAWKRAFLRDFLQGPDSTVHFVPDARRAARALAAQPQARLLVWGTRDRAADQLADRLGVERWRVEDGFLRSSGLGSDLDAPASLVFDGLGIYYDPSAPSDLEQLLERSSFGPAELERARALRERVVAERVSKYNVGVARSVGERRGEGARLALVVGQVEDDESIRRGTSDIRTNASLLREARIARPDAHLLFKPHPDVVSGNRAGAVPREQALRWADEVVDEATLADCLDAADEVHTMTSLVGFEALLRGCHVVVYGQPFYAGWGLTEDRHPHPRRTRRRTLDELVAATLLRYPRYLHPKTRRFTSPECVVEHLAATRRSNPIGVAAARRTLRKAINLSRGLLRVR